MDSDYDYNCNTSDEECDTDLWEEEEHEQEEKKEITYKSLAAGEVAQLMLKEVVEVAGITGISLTAARILLNDYKWDREQLLEKIYSADDRLEELVPTVSQGQFWTPSLHWSGLGGGLMGPWSNAECEICYEDQRREMLGLSCGHQFCRECWVEHITTRLSPHHHHTNVRIECPGHCKVILEDETVLKVLPEGIVRERYHQLISASYVQSNPRLRWCSGPDCSLALSVSALVVEGRELTTTCSAGHSACFSCGLESHQPVSCRLLRLWTVKCQDESETNHWVMANTKQCPKCHATIEKNGGCNHMICGTCTADFCWSCLKLWKDHIPQGCHVWNDDRAQQRDRVKAQLERYLFYRDRFMNNLQSLKLEEQLDSKMKKKLEDVISWVDPRLFDQSLETLASCRRTLMNTYAFAYYLKKNNQKDIFEENQRDLSVATEELSRFLERDITNDTDMEEILPKVQDKFRYCERRRQVLIDHVREGYDNNLWEFYQESSSANLELE